MLRAFALGVIGTLGYVGFRKLQKDGKLDEIVADVRDRAGRLQEKAGKLGEKLAETKDLLVEQTASAREGLASIAGRGTDKLDTVSSPAKSDPWPADKQALPKSA